MVRDKPDIPYEAVGRTESCAFANWSGPDLNDRSYPLAINGYAFPNVIDVSNGDTRVTFHYEPAGMSGPVRVYLPECFPAASDDTGGCDYPWDYSQIAFRYANPAGVFDGKWDLVFEGNNPGFQFTREQDCPSPVGNGNGAPCSYYLSFARSPGGVTAISKPMQVVLLNQANNGVDGSADVAIPMLFTVGGSVDPTPDPDPEATPTPDAGVTQTETLDLYLSDALNLIQQVKKKFGKDDKDAQLTLRTSLRELADQLFEYAEGNNANIATTKVQFNLIKSSKKAKRKLKNFARNKKKGFKLRKKRARKAVLAIRKKLALS